MIRYRTVRSAWQCAICSIGLDWNLKAKATKEAEAHDKEVAEAAVAEHIKENAGQGFPIPGRSMPSDN